jgi:hypothetical protein
MPFTIEDFLNVFENYNTTVFPAQIIFNLLAVLCIIYLIKKSWLTSYIINGILSLLWLWTGIVYHILFFSAINKAAYIFGALFIAQSVIFLYTGIIQHKLEYQIRNDFAGMLGWIFIIYSLLIYPILGYIFGHGYPKQPTFGLPCPTTIFTFGILLFASGRIKWYYIFLPLVWSLIGSSAAIKLGILEDTGLFISGTVGFSLLIFFEGMRKHYSHEGH